MSSIQLGIMWQMRSLAPQVPQLLGHYCGTNIKCLGWKGLCRLQSEKVLIWALAGQEGMDTALRAFMK